MAHTAQIQKGVKVCILLKRQVKRKKDIKTSLAPKQTVMSFSLSEPISEISQEYEEMLPSLHVSWSEVLSSIFQNTFFSVVGESNTLNISCAYWCCTVKSLALSQETVKFPRSKFSVSSHLL